jgi:hypothetical protein
METRLLPVEEPNVRICAFDRLAVQLEDQTQHSVRSGVLRSKIQLHVPEECHSHLYMHHIYQFCGSGSAFILVGFRAKMTHKSKEISSF